MEVSETCRRHDGLVAAKRRQRHGLLMGVYGVMIVRWCGAEEDGDDGGLEC